MSDPKTYQIRFINTACNTTVYARNDDGVMSLTADATEAWDIPIEQPASVEFLNEKLRDLPEGYVVMLDYSDGVSLNGTPHDSPGILAEGYRPATDAFNAVELPPFQLTPLGNLPSPHAALAGPYGAPHVITADGFACMRNQYTLSEFNKVFKTVDSVDWISLIVPMLKDRITNQEDKSAKGPAVKMALFHDSHHNQVEIQFYANIGQPEPSSGEIKKLSSMYRSKKEFFIGLSSEDLIFAPFEFQFSSDLKRIVRSGPSDDSYCLPTTLLLKTTVDTSNIATLNDHTSRLSFRRQDAWNKR